MAKLDDIHNLYRVVWTGIDMFGCSEEFRLEFRRRFQDIGKQICADNGLEFGKPNYLPPTTRLSPAATKKLARLKAWCRKMKAAV